jgi:hypothetical protein
MMPGASALSGDMQQTLSNQLSGSQGLDPLLRQSAQEDQISKQQDQMKKLQDAQDIAKQAGQAPTIPAPTGHPMDNPVRTDHTNKSYQFAAGGFVPSFLSGAAQAYNSTGKNRPRSKPAATDDDASSGDWSWAKNDYDTTGG